MGIPAPVATNNTRPHCLLSPERNAQGRRRGAHLRLCQGSGPHPPPTLDKMLRTLELVASHFWLVCRLVPPWSVEAAGPNLLRSRPNVSPTHRHDVNTAHALCQGPKVVRRDSAHNTPGDCRLFLRGLCLLCGLAASAASVAIVDTKESWQAVHVACESNLPVSVLQVGLFLPRSGQRILQHLLPPRQSMQRTNETRTGMDSWPTRSWIPRQSSSKSRWFCVIRRIVAGHRPS